jgi:hypothetical protein
MTVLKMRDPDRVTKIDGDAGYIASGRPDGGTLMVHTGHGIKFGLALAFLLLVCLAMSPASVALNPGEVPASSPWLPGTIALGGQHGCAIRSNGTLDCWGYCYSGQCSPPEGTYVQLTASQNYTCGLRTDGTLAC